MARCFKAAIKRSPLGTNLALNRAWRQDPVVLGDFADFHHAESAMFLKRKYLF